MFTFKYATFRVLVTWCMCVCVGGEAYARITISL